MTRALKKKAAPKPELATEPKPEPTTDIWRAAFLSPAEADAFARNHAARRQEAFDRAMGRAVSWIAQSQAAIDRSFVTRVSDVLDAELAKGPNHDWL